MNIKDLLANTAKVEHYGGGKESFKNKPFGTIYFYNKTIRAVPNSSIIEISMMSKAVTDKVKPTPGAPPRPVAAHITRISIHGVKQEVISKGRLIERIRLTDSKYKDEKAFPDDLLIEAALNGSVVLFPDKTIMSMKYGSFYSIVDNKISDESEIRVWCSCSAYYWAFQYYNLENKVNLYNTQPKKYAHKTKKGYEAFKSGSPLRNPEKLPGFCKHILMLLALLMSKNVVDSSNDSSKKILKGYTLNAKRFQTTEKLSSKEKKKLIEDYEKDRKKILSQRNYYIKTTGYGKETKQNSWARKNKWNPPKNGRGGYWSSK